MAKSLCFVTGNASKLREVRAILSSGGKPIDVVSQSVDVAEIQGTTQEIARYKCSEAAKVVGGPVVTEDTALCFGALGGLPGPYIRAFLEAVGHDGLNRMLDGFGDRREATALCTFGYCAGPGVEPILFEGECAGRIVPARGPTHFGWDAIFETPSGKTFAEMDGPEKNAISHRSRALAKLRAHLQGDAS